MVYVSNDPKASFRSKFVPDPTAPECQYRLPVLIVLHGLEAIARFVRWCFAIFR